MAVFRFYGQLPQLWNRDGVLLAGGSITFYENGTTTLKNTWSDPGQTVLNTNPVVLDASGRPNTDIWLDGVYSVVVKDADGVIQQTLDDFRLTEDAGLTIPALVSGGFLTNDGSILLWSAIRQVPDPTGESGNFLSNDGANLLWAAIAAPDSVPIEVGTSDFSAGPAGATTVFSLQTGTDSAPSSGTKSTSKAVTFPTPFTTLFGVFITVTSGGSSSQSGAVFVKDSVTSQSVSGFTATFSTATGGSSADSFSNSNLVSPVNFTWFAVGTIPVPV